MSEIWAYRSDLPPASSQRRTRLSKFLSLVLSTTVEQALAVGRRHSREAVLLTVRALEAWQAGVKFFQPEKRLYLAEEVPAGFVEENR